MTTDTKTIVVDSLGPKIVKRYANRKLYDTETSKYVTLGELVSAVTSGREVQVISHATKDDVTGQTLLQALVETESDVAGQTTTLCDILRAGGLSKYVESLKNKASDSFDNGLNAENENQ